MRGMSWAWRGCQKASKNWAWKAAVRNVLGLQRPLTGMQELGLQRLPCSYLPSPALLVSPSILCPCPPGTRQWPAGLSTANWTRALPFSQLKLELSLTWFCLAWRALSPSAWFHPEHSQCREGQGRGPLPQM